MTAALTPWFPMRRYTPVRDGEYEFKYTGSDVGFRPVYRATFRAPFWYGAEGGKLPGLNSDPENFAFRGLASGPSERP
jgi:hypothetical protein